MLGVINTKEKKLKKGEEQKLEEILRKEDLFYIKRTEWKDIIKCIKKVSPKKKCLKLMIK